MSPTHSKKGDDPSGRHDEILELVDAIRRESKSISLASLEECLERAFPDADLHRCEAEIELSHICPTQIALESKKHDLVQLLFSSREDFADLNRKFFRDHPMTVLHLRDGRYAIMDGHHRIRRYAELFGADTTIHVTVLNSRSFKMLENYRKQIEAVCATIGAGSSCSVTDLPVH